MSSCKSTILAKAIAIDLKLLQTKKIKTATLRYIYLALIAKKLITDKKRCW